MQNTTIPAGRERPERGVLLWLRAETFIHVGVGQQSSLIDLPFAREGGTGYPYIPGSGMKGALRDAMRLTFAPQQRADANGEKIDPTDQYFGSEGQAGSTLVSDARLAFLPVRSLSAPYRYLTSEHLLSRLHRDLTFVNWEGDPVAPSIARSHYWDADSASRAADETVFLEEFPFARESGVDIIPILSKLPPDTVEAVKSRAVILADEDFAYFARHGLHVRMRNKLVPETKTVDGGSLWSEESLPPDTLMSVVLIPRLKKDTELLRTLLECFRDLLGGYFQVGGNETVGEGWFSILNLKEAIDALPTPQKKASTAIGAEAG